MKTVLAGFRLAVGLLTIIPVKPPDITKKTARWAMLLAPLAAFPVVLISVGIGWGARWLGLPELLCGIAVIGSLALGTRAMHLDGLADTADGLGSGKDREKALRVMKAGDIGPMGTVMLILILGAQVVSAATILNRPWGWIELTLLLVCARGFLSLACLPSIPAARPEGLGALVAGSVARALVSVQWILLTIILIVSNGIIGNLWLDVIAVTVALFAVVALLIKCVIRFGGITGDVLGACVEIAATCLLVVSAIS